MREPEWGCWGQHPVWVLLPSFLILSQIGKTRYFISWLGNPDQCGPGTAMGTTMLFFRITWGVFKDSSGWAYFGP